MIEPITQEQRNADALRGTDAEGQDVRGCPVCGKTPSLFFVDGLFTVACNDWPHHQISMRGDYPAVVLSDWAQQGPCSRVACQIAWCHCKESDDRRFDVFSSRDLHAMADEAMRLAGAMYEAITGKKYGASWDILDALYYPFSGGVVIDGDSHTIDWRLDVRDGALGYKLEVIERGYTND